MYKMWAEKEGKSNKKNENSDSQKCKPLMWTLSLTLGITKNFLCLCWQLFLSKMLATLFTLLDPKPNKINYMKYTWVILFSLCSMAESSEIHKQYLLCVRHWTKDTKTSKIWSLQLGTVYFLRKNMLYNWVRMCTSPVTDKGKKHTIGLILTQKDALYIIGNFQREGTMCQLCARTHTHLHTKFKISVWCAKVFTNYYFYLNLLWLGSNIFLWIIYFYDGSTLNLFYF